MDIAGSARCYCSGCLLAETAPTLYLARVDANRAQLVQLRLDRLLAAVDLYKALGVGWQPEEQALN